MLPVTVMLQEALATRVPPLKEIVCGAVVDNVPPHCVEDPVVTVNPLGNVSVNAIPLKAIVALGLVSEKVRVELAPLSRVLPVTLR